MIYDGILFYEYPDATPYQADDMSNLMALETVLVNAWLIAGCIFVFAVLLDLRFWSFVTGGFILVVALFAIFLFVGRADDAINNPFYIPQTAALPTIDGFWGTATSADGSITCTPMKGFGWLVAAALMQVCAVSLRASVSIETVIMELKALSSAPARPATDGETTETAPEPEQPKE